jgi:hypothetical protein
MLFATFDYTLMLCAELGDYEMRYVLKPEFKKCVVQTQSWKKKGSSAAASLEEIYRYEEFEVELQEGVALEDWDSEQVELTDTSIFASYKWLDNPVSGDVVYRAVTDVDGDISDEEEEAIADDRADNLEDWEATKYTLEIQCESVWLPVS